jgi:hypothetical protein
MAIDDLLYKIEDASKRKFLHEKKIGERAGYSAKE